MQYALSVPEGTKFDFQNIDVKMYLALKALVVAYEKMADDASAVDWAPLKAAELALAEFELSHGPLPEWAIGHNWAYDLQPGAQLMTKDGRRTGNAHVLRCAMDTQYGNQNREKMLYDCITDAGSYIRALTESELEEQFWVGDFISDPKTLIARFGNHGEDYGLSQGEPDV